ncbi:MAG: hypothetical protein LQ346_008025, partial [Caloplaca aetnensis]
NSVYNIKRRIASLPPIPLDAFDIQKKKKFDIGEASTSSRSSSSTIDEEVSDNEGEQSTSPFQCLFCSQGFATDHIGLATNLEHMHQVHGMSIPDPEMVVDMQSFVGYLATVVRAWHECLYCGTTKRSTLGIQSHMRDKSHCLLNLDREPELLDFWENPQCVNRDSAVALEHERLTTLSATEIRFASGKVIGSRHAAPATRKMSRRQGPAALMMGASPLDSEDAESSPLAVRPQLASGRQLARREEMSILGVSGQQRQALVLAEKKAQRSEVVARRVREWVSAKGSNSQKFDQLDNQMKWGKQNHRLLPR